MTPERTLLSLHPLTRARLDAAKMPLGMSRTKWINDAICQRLDRENPETIGVEAVPPPENEKLEGPYSIKYRKTWRYGMAAQYHAKYLKEGKESPGIEGILERICVNDGKGMTQAQKEAAMEGRKEWRTDSLDVLALFKPVKGEDSDFWGETNNVPKP